MVFRRGGIGPMGRGGARRRTRRRMRRRQSVMLNAQQKAQIERETGMSLDDMTDEQLEAEMKKRGIETAQEHHLDELERLAELKEKGVITEEEFEAKKKQILGL
jgi:hypothetical protein